MRLIIDLDGVCADSYTPWLAAYNKDYNDNLTEADIITWALAKVVKPECGEKIKDYLNAPRFFADLEIYPNADVVLERLQKKGHEIFFVTVSPDNCETAYFDKQNWVRKKFPFVPQRNFCSTPSKFIVKGDLMFDDGEHNLKFFQGLTCAMDKPWNRNARTDHRVSNWLDFEKVVDQIHLSILEG